MHRCRFKSRSESNEVSDSLSPWSYFCLYSPWSPLSLIFFPHSSFTVLSSFYFRSTHENIAKVFSYHWLCPQSVLSKISLIHWMFWIMPRLPLIQPVIPGTVCPIGLAHVPTVPAAPRTLLHPAGMVGGTGTAGIFDHPDYNPAQQDTMISTSNISHHSICCFILGHKRKLFFFPPQTLSFLSLLPLSVLAKPPIWLLNLITVHKSKEKHSANQYENV